MSSVVWTQRKVIVERETVHVYMCGQCQEYVEGCGHDCLSGREGWDVEKRVGFGGHERVSK